MVGVVSIGSGDTGLQSLGALDDYLAIYLLQLGGAGIGEFGEFAD